MLERMRKSHVDRGYKTMWLSRPNKNRCHYCYCTQLRYIYLSHDSNFILLYCNIKPKTTQHSNTGISAQQDEARVVSKLRKLLFDNNVNPNLRDYVSCTLILSEHLVQTTRYFFITFSQITSLEILQSCTWGIFVWNTAYFIAIEWSIFHWITIRYAVSCMKMPYVLNSTIFVLSNYPVFMIKVQRT